MDVVMLDSNGLFLRTQMVPNINII